MGKLIREVRGPVNCFLDIEVEITPQEREEILNALKTLEKYKLKARKTAKHKEQFADWTMYKFDVKHDKVIVKIEAGACG